MPRDERVSAFADAGAGPAPADAAVALHEVIARGHTAWPSLEVDDVVFAAWLGARVLDWSRLADVEAASLLLTCAVAHHVPGAVAAFERAHGPDVDLALRRLGLSDADSDDARQVVLTKLLAPGSDKLSAYAGRGSLAHWVRAVTVRQAISLSRRRGPLERVVAEPSSQDPDVAVDPELGVLKAHYRDSFRAAFASVAESLSAQDRTLLRLRFVEALTLDQLARLRGVHRATIARHLARLRATLLDGVRARLRATAGVASDTELGSALQLVESNLELSLPRILAEA